MTTIVGVVNHMSLIEKNSACIVNGKEKTPFTLLNCISSPTGQLELSLVMPMNYYQVKYSCSTFWFQGILK